MLRNLFGSHVPSDLLLLEDAQSTEIKNKKLVHWQYAPLRVFAYRQHNVQMA
jgi:hypothetical protein